MYNYFLHARTYFVLKRKVIRETIGIKKGIHYAPFVILCAPRSGSTLLHTYLNFHNNIHSCGEILRELKLRKVESDNIISERVFKPYSANIKAVGLKLFYEYGDDSSIYNSSFKEVVNRSDVHVIHLVRNDVLRLYISLKLAEKTNVWSTGRPTAPDHSTKIVVDINEYKAFRNGYQTRQDLFKKMFEGHPIITISYEDLISETEEVLMRVQQFLNVGAQPLKSLLKKQNPGKIEKYVLNYEELLAAGLLS